MQLKNVHGFRGGHTASGRRRAGRSLSARLAMRLMSTARALLNPQRAHPSSGEAVHRYKELQQLHREFIPGVASEVIVCLKLYYPILVLYLFTRRLPLVYRIDRPHNTLNYIYNTTLLSETRTSCSRVVFKITWL